MNTSRTTALALLLSLATSYQVLAQAPWEAPLKTQIERLEAIETPAELATATATLERIAAANPEAWLPNYYAAHANLLQHWMAGEKGCETCLDKTWEWLDKAEATAANNSEILTLRASYYQAMLNLKPMRAPYYGPKAGNLLEAAVKADPTNPRAASLMGQNLYYTPSMFGGGADKARPHMAKAVELFDAEAADAGRDPMLPTWGAARAKAINQKLVASN